jgi:hypothetical protein
VDSFRREKRNYLVNEIYAIDPESPKRVEELKLIADKFGFTEGRFIAKFPADWNDFLKSNFTNLDGPLRLRVMKWIENCEKASLPIEGIDYKRAKSWLSNAKENLSFRKYDAIITKDRDSSNKCVSIEDVLYDDSLADSRGCVIESNINEYIKLMKPLLLVSTELYIQDMNLILFQGVNKRIYAVKFIQALLEKIKQTKRCKKLILILNEVEHPTPESRLKVKNEIDLVANDFGLTNFFVDVRFSNKKLCHGRYIFSMNGALRFDYGFVTPKDSKNEIMWCSKTILEDLKNQHCIY